MYVLKKKKHTNQAETLGLKKKKKDVTVASDKIWVGDEDSPDLVMKFVANSYMQERASTAVGLV